MSEVATTMPSTVTLTPASNWLVSVGAHAGLLHSLNGTANVSINVAAAAASDAFGNLSPAIPASAVTGGVSSDGTVSYSKSERICCSSSDLLFIYDISSEFKLR